MAKKTEKKTKARERKKAVGLTTKRLFEARRARYEREVEKDVRKNMDKLPPIRREMQIERIQENLEKNAQMLKALEEQFVQSQEKRENLKQELEAEGFSSLEEKFQAMQEKALRHAERIQEEIIEDKRMEHEDSLAQ